MDFGTLTSLIGDLSDQFLHCEICYEKFDYGARKPVVLPCHHSFCRDCMYQLLQHQQSACSKCRASILPSITLQVDFTRMQLMDLMQRHVSGKDDPQKNGTHNRRFVWRGSLKFLSDKEGKVTSHLLKACMSVGMDEPQLNTQNWPHTVYMQLLPQFVLKALTKQVQDSRSLIFHFPQSDSVKNLHRLMLRGLIGSAYFPITSQTLLLLYDHRKKTLVGALPNNSVAFAQGFRKVLQRCIQGAKVKWAPLQPEQASILQKVGLIQTSVVESGTSSQFTQTLQLVTSAQSSSSSSPSLQPPQSTLFPVASPAPQPPSSVSEMLHPHLPDFLSIPPLPLPSSSVLHFSHLLQTLTASSQAMLAAPSSGQNQRSSSQQFRQDSPLPSESGRDEDLQLPHLPSWHKALS